MREDDKFRMDGFACTSAEVDSPAADSLNAHLEEDAQSSVRKRAQSGNNAHPGRRPVVALLVGSLLLMLGMVAAPTPSFARLSVGIFVNFGPPALPVYEQPPCPAPGYIWTPGYWAWDPAYGYYWVPGTWVAAPFVGAMWTPGYWDYDGGGYRWSPGYWGLSVGWYGGIDYGFGYTGYGYHGGYWNHDRFYYNRAVNRLEGRDFSHVYYRREFHHFGDRRVSYHGGPGGINFGPTREQRAASRERHYGPVRQQLEQRRFARRDPGQRARRNFGRPGIAATRRPGSFRGGEVVHASRAGAPYRAPEQRMRGGRVQYSAPGRSRNNDRGFRSFNSRRDPRPNVQRENRAPAQRMNAQRPVYRNNQRAFERPQRQARPQQMRSGGGRSAPAGHGSPQREQAHGGHGNDGGHGHGRGGRR